MARAVLSRRLTAPSRGHCRALSPFDGTFGLFLKSRIAGSFSGVKFKYRLPESWVKKVATLEEFETGATQVSIELKDGRVFRKVLVASSTYIVAARGLKYLPFEMDDIRNIFQFAEDRTPAQRDGWQFWDAWDDQAPKLLK